MLNKGKNWWVINIIFIKKEIALLINDYKCCLKSRFTLIRPCQRY